MIFKVEPYLIACSTMVVIKPILLVLVSSCLIATQAFLSKNIHGAAKQDLPEVSNKCTPGKFYKRGCKQCFCDDSRRPVCSGTSDCKLVNTIPKSPTSIRSYSREELKKLPALVHQASDCTPGAWYRVECNTCACLANKNLICNELLCPSYEDINRIKAKSTTGKACTPENENQECIKCSCIDLKLQCEATPNCVPTEGRRDFQKEQPIDLALNEMKKLEKTCTPGMVYKRDCNRCYCQKDQSLRCTLMKCLKNTEVKRLKKLRLQLEREGL